MLLNIAEDVGISLGGDQNKTIKRSPHVFYSNGRTGYLNPNTQKTFIQLREAFTQALILQHFDPKRYI